MLPLAKPSFTTDEVFIGCVSGIQDQGLRDGISRHAPRITAADNAFEDAGMSNEFYRLHSADFQFVSMIPDKDLVEHIYTRGLVGRHAGRVYYDKIMSISKHDRCPLCGYGEVKTLDHHLPKAIFPTLCVSVGNLFPVCTDCNKYKRESFAKVQGKQTLHPYYDSIEFDSWLGSRLLEESPAMVEFFVDPPEHWDLLLRERVQHHFNSFHLARRYTLQANRTIASFRNSVQTWIGAEGPSVVSNTLRELATSHRAENVNGWDGLTFQALAESEYFCAGRAYE